MFLSNVCLAIHYTFASNSASSLFGVRLRGERTRYTSPVPPGPVSLALGNGKEKEDGGVDVGEKNAEEAESALLTTPTSAIAMETTTATG